MIVGPALLEALRNYWRVVGPRHWLFPSQRYVTPLSIQIAQRAFTAAKRRAGIDKIGGIHALRHAYATHQLEAGIPVHQLQRLLGHQDIRTTLRYVHWVPDYREGKNSVDLITGMAVRHG